MPNGSKHGKEIEQRFLVKYLPPEVLTQLTKDKRFTISPQAYLSETKRVRRIKDSKGVVSYFKTTKIREQGDDLPADTSVKDEKEEPIEENVFRRKLKSAKHKISKRRYSVDLDSAIPDGAIVDFDVMRSWSILPWRSIRRRILVEVEFKDLDQAKNFVPPEWFGRNVTNEVSTRRLAKANRKAVRAIRQSMKMPAFTG